VAAAATIAARNTRVSSVSALRAREKRRAPQSVGGIMTVNENVKG